MLLTPYGEPRATGVGGQPFLPIGQCRGVEGGRRGPPSGHLRAAGDKGTRAQAVGIRGRARACGRAALKAPTLPRHPRTLPSQMASRDSSPFPAAFQPRKLQPPQRLAMTPRLTARILGCGSSAGVPRIGGDWGDCDPTNPKNRRSRCSLLLERTTPARHHPRAHRHHPRPARPAPRRRHRPPRRRRLHPPPRRPHPRHRRPPHRRAEPPRPPAGLGRRRHRRAPDVPLRLRLRPARRQPLPADPRPPPHRRPLRDRRRRRPASPSAPSASQHGRIEALGFRINDFAYLPDVSAIPDATWPELARPRHLRPRRPAPQAAPDPHPPRAEPRMARPRRPPPRRPHQHAQRPRLRHARSPSSPPASSPPTTASSLEIPA